MPGKQQQREEAQKKREDATEEEEESDEQNEENEQEGDKEERKEEVEDEEDSESEDKEERAPIRRLCPSDLANYYDMIMEDTFHHYYLSDDWSPDWHYKLAYEAFISVAHGSYLLPEIQRAYCVLDFQNLHAGRKTRRLLKKNYRLYNNRDWDTCVQGVCDYWGDKNWFSKKYAEMVKSSKLRHHAIALYDEDDRLIAGECGYTVGRIYTSLTGFCTKDVPNCGTFQLYYLGRWLQRCGYAFWNLGHPPSATSMRYKADLGGVVLERGEFLKERWRPNRGPFLSGKSEKDDQFIGLDAHTEFDFSNLADVNGGVLTGGASAGGAGSRVQSPEDGATDGKMNDAMSKKQRKRIKKKQKREMSKANKARGGEKTS